MGGGCLAIILSLGLLWSVQKCITSHIPKICEGAYLSGSGFFLVMGGSLFSYGAYYIWKSIQKPPPKKHWYGFW